MQSPMMLVKPRSLLLPELLPAVCQLPYRAELAQQARLLGELVNLVPSRLKNSRLSGVYTYHRFRVRG